MVPIGPVSLSLLPFTVSFLIWVPYVIDVSCRIISLSGRRVTPWLCHSTCSCCSTLSEIGSRHPRRSFIFVIFLSGSRSENPLKIITIVVLAQPFPPVGIELATLRMRPGSANHCTIDPQVLYFVFFFLNLIYFFYFFICFSKLDYGFFLSSFLALILV